MSGRGERRRLLHIEHAVDQIDVIAHQIKEFPFARCIAVGDCRLQQMSCAVQLMVIAPRKAVFRLEQSEIGIEIAVVHAVLFDFADNLVNNRFQRRIALLFAVIRCRLHPLGDVGIPENMRTVRHSLSPAEAECFKASGFGKTLVDIPHGNLTHALLFFVPETTCQINAFHCDGTGAGVGLNHIKLLLSSGKSGKIQNFSCNPVCCVIYKYYKQNRA